MQFFHERGIKWKIRPPSVTTLIFIPHPVPPPTRVSSLPTPFLSLFLSPFAIFIPRPLFSLRAPPISSGIPLLFLRDPFEDDFSRSISRFSLPRCIWRSLFKPAKSRIVDYLDRHVESFRGTPCGFRPRSRANLEPMKGLSLSGQSELTFVTCHPISRLVRDDDFYSSSSRIVLEIYFLKKKESDGDYCIFLFYTRFVLKDYNVTQDWL